LAPEPQFPANPFAANVGNRRTPPLPAAVHMIKLTKEQKIAAYLRLHPEYDDWR
jgi:hypothetical protein